jgi:hypothetical protein
MVVAFVRSLSTVLLSELDPIAFDLVHGADMNAVGTHDFHVFPDRVGVDHVSLQYADAIRSDVGSMPFRGPIIVGEPSLVLFVLPD